MDKSQHLFHERFNVVEKADRVKGVVGLNPDSDRERGSGDHGLWQSHRLPDNGHAVTHDLRPTPLLAVVGANHRGRQPGGAVPLQIDCGSRPSGLWIIIAHCIALRRHNRPTFDNRTIRLYSGVYSSPSAAAFTSSVIRCSSPSTPRRRIPNRAEYPPPPIPISRWLSSHHIPISDFWPRNRCVRQPPVRCPCGRPSMSFALCQSRSTALSIRPALPRPSHATHPIDRIC